MSLILCSHHLPAPEDRIQLLHSAGQCTHHHYFLILEDIMQQCIVGP
ncbi:MAG: hypothetical protein ACK559_19235 [bacterium]